MNPLLKRAGGAVLGLLIMLAWWSWRGGSDSNVQKGIPAKVWDGGGGTLTIEAETSVAARFSITFGERDQENGRSLEAWTTIPAGSHSWTIDVPPRVGGYIDLTAENPKVGDRLSWKVVVNGAVVDEQAEGLDQPLEPAYAFGLQAYFEDYSTGELGED